MKTSEHFFNKCDELEDSDRFRAISVEEIATIQADAREGMVSKQELREFIQAWKLELENQWAMRNFTGFVSANDARFSRLESLLSEKKGK